VVPKDGKFDPKIRPSHLLQYPGEVVEFVYANLKPRLTRTELDELDKAEGKVAVLATLLVQYAEQYPVLPPIAGKDGPTNREQLPREVQQKLPQGKGFDKGAKAALLKKYKSEVEVHHGQWPDYAVAVARFVNEEKVSWKSDGLGACKPADF